MNVICKTRVRISPSPQTPNKKRGTGCPRPLDMGSTGFDCIDTERDLLVLNDKKTKVINLFSEQPTSHRIAA